MYNWYLPACLTRAAGDKFPALVFVKAMPEAARLAIFPKPLLVKFVLI